MNLVSVPVMLAMFSEKQTVNELLNSDITPYDLDLVCISYHVWIKLQQLCPPGFSWRLPTVFNVNEDIVNTPQQLQGKF